MTTAMPAINVPQNDAELVSASRSGDREAFGRIVRRYQAMVSGLIYAACGDVQRSEDLAQETFLSAWKSLSGLREPAKLPAWLCQIARHRAHDLFRKSTAEKTAVAGFWSRVRETALPPDQQMIQKEEQAVVWAALVAIPQPYRETLVLYYRQGNSTSEVAAAMETTEESVRQRLSRGREMLRGQVSELIERNLQSTAPGPAFALAVMTALPAAAPIAATTASVGTVAKGSLAANPGWLASIAPWIGLVGGLGGGFAGSWAALRADRTAAERKLTVRFMIQLWLVVVLLIPASGAVSRLNGQYRWSDQTYICALAALYSIAWGAIATVVIRYQMRSPRVRGPNRDHAKLGVAVSIAMAVGPVVGGLAWLMNLALSARDHAAAGSIAAGIVVFAACVYYTLRRAVGLTMLVETIGFAAIIVATLSWRLDTWTATLRHLNSATVNAPLWPVYGCAAIVVAWISALTILARRSLRESALTEM